MNNSILIITNILKAQEGICAAILFGSVSSGTDLNDSDIDIALLTERAFLSTEKLEIYFKLAAKVDRDLDLIFITSDTSYILLNEIARRGKLLFTKDTKKSDEFMIRAPQLYEDLMYTRRPLEEAYIQRSLQ